MRSSRSTSHVGLAFAGAVLVLVGGLLAYSGAVLSNSARVTTPLIATRPDLTAVRPLIEAAADRVVGSQPFQSLFRGATYDLHRSVFDTDANTITLRVADVGVLVDAALQSSRRRLPLVCRRPSGPRSRPSRAAIWAA